MPDKAAIVSVDGHVEPPRPAYRDEVDPGYRDAWTRGLRPSTARPAAACARSSMPPAGGRRRDASPILDAPTSAKLSGPAHVSVSCGRGDTT